MAVLQMYKGEAYLWNYIPSMVGAIIFIVLFFTTSALHFWRLFTPGTRFCWPFAIGCIFELVGYCARASSVNQTGQLAPYAVQSAFILIAPALFAASIYMSLGRIMRYVKGEHYSLVRITWVTKAFVWGDILSFTVQGNAAGLMFKPATQNIGQIIVTVGLFIQIISFGLFFLTAVNFQIRMNKNPTRESMVVKAPWRQTLYMLHAVSVLIMIRSIFRVVEYIQGQHGYSLKHEWTLWVFDSVPMFIVTVLFFLRYPNHIPASDSPISGSVDSQDVELVGDAGSYQPKASF